ncbi:hypothetical protein ACFYL6_15385 [Micromonospora sp. NPDC007208]|uniref:hypothetical protein n=1 Tax=Micromonospora sp. NPDC007208 TaxID=3364236 RepID=UPI0036CBD8E2
MTCTNIMLSKVNACQAVAGNQAIMPVMATPAAFVVAFKAGAQIAAWAVAGAAAGAAIAKTANS